MNARNARFQSQLGCKPSNAMAHDEPTLSCEREVSSNPSGSWWSKLARSQRDRCGRRFAWCLAYFLCLTTAATAQITTVGQTARDPVFLYPNIGFNYYDEDGIDQRFTGGALSYMDFNKVLDWVETFPPEHAVWPYINAAVGSILSEDDLRSVLSSGGISGYCDDTLSNKYTKVPNAESSTLGFAYEVECIKTIYYSGSQYATYPGYSFSMQHDFNSSGSLLGCDVVSSSPQSSNVSNLHTYFGAFSGTSTPTSQLYLARYLCGFSLDDPMAQWRSQLPSGYIGGYLSTVAFERLFSNITTADYDSTNPPDIFNPVDLSVVPCSSENVVVGGCGGSGTGTDGGTGTGTDGGTGTGTGTDGGTGTGTGTDGGTGTGTDGVTGTGTDGGTGTGTDGGTGTGTDGGTGTGTDGGTGTGTGETGDSSIFENFPDIPNTEIDVSTGFGGNGWINASCPAPVSFAVFGQSFDLPYDHLCFAADKFGYIVVATSMLLGLGIVMRGFA